MQKTLTKVQYYHNLHAGQVVALHLFRPHTLQARNAPVWVTRADDATDYWIMPGESFELEGGRQHWISTDQPAELQLEYPVGRAVSLMRRLRDWLKPRQSTRGGCGEPI